MCMSFFALLGSVRSWPGSRGPRKREPFRVARVSWRKKGSRSRSAIKLGPVGPHLNFFASACRGRHVARRQVGEPSKEAGASSAAMDLTGSLRRRPMASAMSRAATPLRTRIDRAHPPFDREPASRATSTTCAAGQRSRPVSDIGEHCLFPRVMIHGLIRPCRSGS